MGPTENIVGGEGGSREYSLLTCEFVLDEARVVPRHRVGDGIGRSC